ncbi:MAG: 4Fe-4S binding protein [Lachnospiraceae bacterium]|nr:4Fe-4S binding protein [Lachnospiraceae bacterium]
MAFQINDACVSCGACESQCPVGAIAMGDTHYEIDADKCISCGSCAGACPTGSISEE